MIVKMSKVEVAGPRELLEKTLFQLQETGLLQIAPSSRGFLEDRTSPSVDAFLPDSTSASLRLFFESVKREIDEIFTYFKTVPREVSSLDPRPVLDSINALVQRHIRTCRELDTKKKGLERERDELSRHNAFLDSVVPLLKDLHRSPDMELIGLTLRNAQAEETLKGFLDREARGAYQFMTAPAPDNSVVGLIAVNKNSSALIKSVLSERNVPELHIPFTLEGMSMYQKMDLLRKRSAELDTEIDALDIAFENLARQWGPVYRKTQLWIDEYLSVMNAEGSVFETKMCFLIYGWMATGEVGRLRSILADRFTGKVVLEEMEVREQDLGQMPVVLKNPNYFKPFELLTRILPLPHYTSYDPTPFIGIFFPLFFGLILGDSGYALVIMALSLYLTRRHRKREMIADAGRILLVCSVYAFFFGILYGECFGDMGMKVLHMKPLFLERGTAIIPMLYFAVTVGIVHVLIGSALGIISACRKKTKQEAVCKSLHFLTVLAMLTLIASMVGLFPALLTRPVVIAILILTPLLLFTGGLLAPLELLKSMGNIISYARIMAIGLTSVLLAHVANRLAGMTGDIATGIVVACLLHLLNIIIGVFSPTIHALRLHYVEFFSKFIEHGGRKFEPFKKKEIM